MSSKSSAAVGVVPSNGVNARAGTVAIRKGGQDVIKSTLRKDQKDMIERWECQAKQGTSVQQQVPINPLARSQANKIHRQIFSIMRPSKTQLFEEPYDLGIGRD